MEKQQLIICVGREFGSGGHAIAERLAAKYDLPLFDHNLLDAMCEENHMDAELMRKYDEMPKKLFVNRKVKGYSSSMEENVAQMQFDYLKKMADRGESFVVVGRCAEFVLKYHPAAISLFVLGDEAAKIERVMNVYHMTEKEAKDKMKRHDRYRKMYHNFFAEGKWGDSRLYDLCINSSRMGIDKTADSLEEYINARLANR